MKKITLNVKLKTVTLLNRTLASVLNRAAVFLILALSFANNTAAQHGTFLIKGSGADLPISDIGITPFDVKSRDSRVQYLYLDNEFNTPAFSGYITAIAFDVSAYGASSTNITFSIKMGTTASNSNSAGLFSGLVDVGSFNSSMLPAAPNGPLGWVTIPLTTPFFYDYNGGASDNIVVEICKSTPTVGAVNWTVNGSVQNNSVCGRKTLNNAQPQNPVGCSMPNTPSGNCASATTTSTKTKQRPNIKFIFQCSTLSMPMANGTASDLTAGLHGCLGDPVILGVSNASNGDGIQYQWQSSVNGTTWTNIPAPEGTFEKYQTIQTGTTMYYRRSTSCGSTSVDTQNIITVPGIGSRYNAGLWTPGPPAAGEAAQIESNLSFSNDMDLCGMIVAPGALVTIQAGKTLTIGNRIVVQNGGQLVFEDNSALIQTDKNAVNVGNVSYKRETESVNRYDFTYWSSPVKAQTLVGFSPLTLADKYYSWNQAGNPQTWAIESPANTMTPGKGYIIRAPQTFATTGAGAKWMGTFTGVPNNGDIKMNFRRGHEMINLLGNPYPSAISAQAFFDAHNAFVDGTFYFWTHATGTTSNGSGQYDYSGSDYAMYNLTGPVVTTPTAQAPNGYIAAGQSFMIKAKNGSSIGTLIDYTLFTNAMRKDASFNTTFFRGAAGSPTENTAVDTEKHRVWLNLTTGTSFKQLLVGYVDGATMDYDNGYDGDAMGGSVLNFYSKMEGHNLSIQARPLPFNPADQVPLGFSTTVNGNHQLSLSRFDGMFTSQEVYLEDTMLNVVVNLKNGPYNFTSVSGNFPNRFKLRYTTTATLKAEELKATSAIAEGFIAYKQQADLHINGGSALINSVQVYDLSGRLLTTQANVNATQLVFANPNWSSQVLIVQITTVDNMIITKKVVF